MILLAKNFVGMVTLLTALVSWLVFSQAGWPDTPLQEQEQEQEVSGQEYKLGPNLIQNFSAETATADPKLAADWETRIWSGEPLFEIETSFARTGGRCFKIHSAEGADASWSFRVELERNTEYQLSAWVKTEDLAAGGLGALLNLHELQMEGKADSMRGTHEWTPVTTEFNSGAHDSLLVNLLFGGWGRATGTAWFDDIELREIQRPVAPVLSEDEALVLFESKVLPILKKHCFDCHGSGEKIRAELVMTNREDLIAGGESGIALDLEEPADSLLLEVINYDSYEMPPSGKLPDEDIQSITQWVMAGAPWKGEGFKPDRDAEVDGGPPEVNAETKQWWAYQPVQRPVVPQVDMEWGTNEIDQFIAEKLQAKQLTPAEPANRRQLIRRAFYDLTGLPPTPQEVADFVADDSPNAYPELIERLLASPHYGEKWGRHWLDVVRYAESNSYERDGTKPFVWRYRDYVIRAFNEDKPYDMFLMEQLAGDEMNEVTAERVIATGYYRLGLWDDEPVDRKQAWFDDMDDVLATTSQGILGMTINCARCHDHKIDPVPTEDYYRLLAFFRNVERYGVRGHDTVKAASVRVIADPETQEKHQLETDRYRKQVEANKLAMAEIETLVKEDFIPVEHEEFRSEMNRVPLVEKRAGGVITQQQADEYAKLFKEMRRLRNNPPKSLEEALCVKEGGSNPQKTFVQIRGNANAEGKEVSPGFPSVLSPPEPEIEVPAEGLSTGRRMALARWITDPANPLTARVMANRIWQHHFGRGIVRSASDFGFQGTPPTHPELLDWLASEFVERDWSVKAMHRLIMLSSAYQMASRFNQAAYDVDPMNDLIWRFDMRRLTAEEIRDSILAVNGTLNKEKMYGPSIYPIIPDEVLQGQSRPGENWGRSSPEDLARRSVYVHIKRSLPVPILASFDVADPDTPCPVRFNTVQPTQALGMINSEFLKRQSNAYADTIIRQLPNDLEKQISQVLLNVTQRPPTDEEVRRGVDFVKRVQSEDNVDQKEAVRQFCLMALNLNEFLFLD